MDGGPIFAIQVDNETTDWKYLLALKALALECGMYPAAFTKTGWPQPGPGCPKDLALIPYFGGYPDQFWSHVNHTEASFGAYSFGGPSGELPQGYPYLGVEYGGGMQASYDHRVLLNDSDVPALNLVQFASGANGMGYYMYHG